MSTTKQKLAIEKIVENRGNVSKAMVEVGYTTASAKNPQNLTSSKGYQAFLEECGLTPGLVVKALVADIKAKKGRRTPELRLAADILGMRKLNIGVELEKTPGKYTYQQLFNPRTQARIKELNEVIKKELISH